MKNLARVVLALALSGLYLPGAVAQCAYCATRAFCAASSTGFEGCTFTNGACYNYGNRCGGTSFWYWYEPAFEFRSWPDDGYYWDEKSARIDEGTGLKAGEKKSRPFSLQAASEDLQPMAERAPRLAQVLWAMVARSQGNAITTGEYVTSLQWQGLEGLQAAIREGSSLPALDGDDEDLRVAVGLRRTAEQATLTVFLKPDGPSEAVDLLTADFVAAGHDLGIDGKLTPRYRLGTWLVTRVQMFREERPSPAKGCANRE